MNLCMYRFGLGADSTLSKMYVDDVFECFMLEDELRRVKVAGETAISTGKYDITLRTNSARFEAKYSKRFSFHKGMIWIRSIPNFSYCYIHIGNLERDTAGCPLTGDVPLMYPDGEFHIGRSTVAYERLYKKVISSMDEGDTVSIEIFNSAKHIVEGV